MIDEAKAAKLSEYDIRVAVDASGSMSTKDCPGGRSRWDYMQETVAQFAREVEEFDTDGLDILIFNGLNGVLVFEGVKSDKIEELFRVNQPRGSTPTAAALSVMFEMGKTKGKKSINAVFTDGIPDDGNALSKAIIAQANSQEADDDCTVLFIQVGGDTMARDYLRILDDDLKGRGAKFDIVDCKSQAEAEAYSSFAELVLDAIDD